VGSSNTVLKFDGLLDVDMLGKQCSQAIFCDTCLSVRSGLWPFEWFANHTTSPTVNADFASMYVLSRQLFARASDLEPAEDWARANKRARRLHVGMWVRLRPSHPAHNECSRPCGCGECTVCKQPASHPSRKLKGRMDGDGPIVIGDAAPTMRTPFRYCVPYSPPPDPSTTSGQHAPPTIFDLLASVGVWEHVLVIREMCATCHGQAKGIVLQHVWRDVCDGQGDAGGGCWYPLAQPARAVPRWTKLRCPHLWTDIAEDSLSEASADGSDPEDDASMHSVAASMRSQMSIADGDSDGEAPGPLVRRARR
jgi:hypothetical protein